MLCSSDCRLYFLLNTHQWFNLITLKTLPSSPQARVLLTYSILRQISCAQNKVPSYRSISSPALLSTGTKHWTEKPHASLSHNWERGCAARPSVTKTTSYSVCSLPSHKFIKAVHLCSIPQKQNAIKLSLKSISTGILLFSLHKNQQLIKLCDEC